MTGVIQRGKVIRGDLARWDGRSNQSTRKDASGGTVTGLVVDNEVDVVQVFGSGTNFNSSTLARAIEHVGSEVVTFVLAPGDWAITANATIPATVAVKIPSGVDLQISTGITLTINGPVYADQAGFSSGAGTLALGSDSIVDGQAWIKRTAAEIAAGVTPTNYAYPPGHGYRYSMAGDDSTNNNTALAAAIAQAVAGGAPVYIPRGTFRVYTNFELGSDVVIYGEGDHSVIRQMTANTDIFSGDEAHRVHISKLKFKGIVSTTSHAAIDPVDCDDWAIEDVSFVDWSFICIRQQGTGSTYNKRLLVMRAKYASTAVTQMGDSCLIGLLDYSDGATVEDPYCTAVVSHGVLMQNTNSSGGTPTTCTNHKIIRPYCRNQTTYGLVGYRANASGEVSNLLVVDPDIADIDGAALGGASGAGVYFVGCVDARIRGGVIENTNINTSVESLAPAAVGISAARGDHSVIGTKIVSPVWYGVMVGSTAVAGSKIRVDVQVEDNDKAGLYLKDAGIVDATGSQIKCAAGVKAVLIINTADVNDYRLPLAVECSGISGPVDLTNATGVDLTGLRITGSGTGAYAGVIMEGCDNITMGSGRIDMGANSTGPAFSITSCTGLRVDNVGMKNNGTDAIIVTAGTCTGGNFGKGNRYETLVFNNGGTGCRIEHLGTAAPASGTNVAGDTVWFLAPAAAASPGSICTTGGTPGTWKDMAAIAA